jgi:hypothetical protein
MRRRTAHPVARGTLAGAGAYLVALVVLVGLLAAAAGGPDTSVGVLSAAVVVAGALAAVLGGATGTWRALRCRALEPREALAAGASGPVAVGLVLALASGPRPGALAQALGLLVGGALAGSALLVRHAAARSS